MSYAIGEVQAIADDLPGAAPLTQPAAPTGAFGTWFVNELEAVNTKLGSAEQGLQLLASGEASSLHDVMIRMEEARLSFQVALQFRNRVLEAYQEVMRMQV